MRPRVVLIAAVTLGVLAGGQAHAATVLWKSKLMVVTQDGRKTIFKNRTENKIRYACAWATTNKPGSPYSTDGTRYVLDARSLRPAKSYYWTDPNPSAVQCVVKKKVWPSLPILTFNFAVSEYASDAFQVLSQPQCASNCDYTLYFQNLVRSTVSFSCSWTNQGISQSWSATIGSYRASLFGTGNPDDGSMTCSVTPVP